MILETQSDFARRLGRDKSHVTRLKQAGRLVMLGGKVVVNDSLALIEATESPLPRDIAKREALEAVRQRRAETPGTFDGQSLETIGRRIKAAQARKLSAEADKAEMERARIEGTLCETGTVLAAAADMAVVLRDALEGLADRLAPQLAASSDANQAHALITEHVEIILQDIMRDAGSMADRLRSEP